MAAPINIPYDHFQSVQFMLRRYTFRNELYGGITQVQEVAAPRWVAQYRTALLTPEQAGVFKSFWDQLRGGMVTFLGYDPSQSVPVAYVRTGLPAGFSGAISVGYAGSNTWTISGMPSGFVLQAGDLMQVNYGDLRGLFRLTNNITGTGGSASVWPVIPSILQSASSGTLLRPGCAMIADPNSWQYTAEANQMTSASFTAVQRVY
jgi:hypothetical protein